MPNDVLSQVLENIRLQSVEGLALPFLANWLLGDLSNLIGCILTHQLPFQTYLAVYFCLVDLSLFGQYFYYRQPSKPGYQAIPSRGGSILGTRRLSLERPARYRTISNVAAHVAVAAARAAEQEGRWHHSEADHDEVDEQALACLTESFHSDIGPSSRHKTVSWSKERGRSGSLSHTRQSTMSPTGSRLHHSLRMTSPPPNELEEAFSARGRPTTRDSVEEHHLRWPSSYRRNASRKGASMVFLGVWALFGVGTLAGTSRGLPNEGVRIGRVFARDEHTIPGLDVSIPNSFTQTSIVHVVPIFGSRPVSVFFENRKRMESAHDPHEPDEPSPSTDYIIGRISAWICTTLYLTSRLPQIWKNYTRKSVEGLSIYLFVFAFLGNFFYVASILTSPNLALPPRESSAFLRESIPYLLGSGGTLMFDVTIVTQSFIYRPKAHTRGRRISRSISEEEAGLLSAGGTGAEDAMTPSRRRLGTGGAGTVTD